MSDRRLSLPTIIRPLLLVKACLLLFLALPLSVYADTPSDIFNQKNYAEYLSNLPAELSGSTQRQVK